MRAKRVWAFLLFFAGLAVAAAGLLLRGPASPGAADPTSAAPYRNYTATGQVMGIQALGASGCRVRVKLHQWVSLSDGFSLAEMPQKGQLYTIAADPEQCVAVEVALASQGDPEDLESPRHIYYKAGQLRSGDWLLADTPKAPQGCSGL